MIDHSRCQTITRSWLIGSTNVWSPTHFFCSLLFSHIKYNICIYTYMYILGMKYLYQERQKTLQATESYECYCIGCYHFVSFGTYIKFKKSVQHSNIGRCDRRRSAGKSVMQVFSTKLIIATQFGNINVLPYFNNIWLMRWYTPQYWES